MILDYVTASGSVDEVLSTSGEFLENGKPSTRDLTIQWSMIYEGLLNSVQSEGAEHSKGNIGPHRPTDSGDEWSMTDQSSDSRSFNATRALDAPPVTTWPATVAYEKVLNFSGAMLPVRDEHDIRIVNDVRNGTGGFIDEPSEVGEWPDYKSTTPPEKSI